MRSISTLLCCSMPQFLTHEVVLIDGPVVAERGCGRSGCNELIDRQFIAQEVRESGFCVGLLIPLDQIGCGGRETLGQFICGVNRQGPIAGQKMKSPILSEGEIRGQKGTIGAARVRQRPRTPDRRSAITAAECLLDEDAAAGRNRNLRNRAGWSQRLPPA